MRINNEKLVLTFTQKADKILPLSAAALETAHDIYSKHKNIYVAMSGGCDSEFVADSFVKANIPFTPVMLVCDNYTKIHKWYVDEWCARNNKTLEVIHINFDMLMSVSKKKATAINAVNGLAVSSSIVGDYVKQKGGRLVTGAMPAYWPDPKLQLGRNINNTQFSGFYIDEDDFYIEALRPNYHPWAFAYWSPSMLASIINEWDTTISVEDNKWKLFNQWPRPKLNGSEMIMQNSAANQLPEYVNKIKWTQECKNNCSQDFYPLMDKDQLLELLVN